MNNTLPPYPGTQLMELMMGHPVFLFIAAIVVGLFLCIINRPEPPKVGKGIWLPNIAEAAPLNPPKAE